MDWKQKVASVRRSPRQVKATDYSSMVEMNPDNDDTDDSKQHLARQRTIFESEEEDEDESFAKYKTKPKSSQVMGQIKLPQCLLMILQIGSLRAFARNQKL